MEGAAQTQQQEAAPQPPPHNPSQPHVQLDTDQLDSTQTTHNAGGEGALAADTHADKQDAFAEAEQEAEEDDELEDDDDCDDQHSSDEEYNQRNFGIYQALPVEGEPDWSMGERELFDEWCSCMWVRDVVWLHQLT